MITFKQLMEAKKPKPRVFYRGQVPDSTKRIKTGADDWDNHFFVSSNKKSASMYGSRIHEYHAEPDAKILYHGTKEYRSMAKGIKSPRLFDHVREIARRAKEAGYHAVHFERQGDVGTTVFDKSKFKKVAEYDYKEEK